MWDAAKKHMENAERACGRQMAKSVQHNVAMGNGRENSNNNISNSDVVESVEGYEYKNRETPITATATLTSAASTNQRGDECEDEDEEEEEKGRREWESAVAKADGGGR